jgi:hypothetical protein
MANARVTVPSGHLVFPQPSEHHWPAVLTREGIVLLPTFYGLLFAVGACREHARRQENATPTEATAIASAATNVEFPIRTRVFQ